MIEGFNFREGDIVTCNTKGTINDFFKIIKIDKVINSIPVYSHCDKHIVFKLQQNCYIKKCNTYEIKTVPNATTELLLSLVECEIANFNTVYCVDSKDLELIDCYLNKDDDRYEDYWYKKDLEEAEREVESYLREHRI